jgi:hypothetical protein
MKFLKLLNGLGAVFVVHFTFSLKLPVRIGVTSEIVGSTQGIRVSLTTSIQVSEHN